MKPRSGARWYGTSASRWSDPRQLRVNSRRRAKWWAWKNLLQHRTLNHPSAVPPSGGNPRHSPFARNASAGLLHGRHQPRRNTGACQNAEREHGCAYDDPRRPTERFKLPVIVDGRGGATNQRARKTHSRPKRGLRPAQPRLHYSDHAKGLGSKRNERQSYEGGQSSSHRSGMDRISPYR
jgi:hypothetical protein